MEGRSSSRKTRYIVSGIDDSGLIQGSDLGTSVGYRV